LINEPRVRRRKTFFRQAQATATPRTTTRRAFLKTSAVGAGGCALASPAASPPPAVEPDTVRDRVWIFTCTANRDYLKLVDVITLWTSDPNRLAHLETNLKKVEALSPQTRKMPGGYVVDYGRKEGTPLPWMQRQCETGLRWLQERWIEGIIFLGNTTMDLSFPSVDWTREWIQKVAQTRL
jgi:hypothetical protein